MSSPSDSDPRKEKVVIYDLSPQLEAELQRRAREKNTSPESEAAKIIEEHADGDIAD
jgi:hypothetical protein